MILIDYGVRRRNSSRSSLEFDINRSRSGSICSSRSITKQKHPISVRDRNLIQVQEKGRRDPLIRKDRTQSCFQNPHEIIGQRILKRATEKRNGFANFCAKLNNDEKEEIEEEIKILLKKTVANINFIDEVQRLAEEFGGKHVKFRALGFKPDFFGVYADATITECIFLDNAVHPTHHTLTAFSSFITMVYSSVRDGFYGEMRRLRRASNSFSTGSSSSVIPKTASTDLSGDLPPRSTSPCNESDSSEYSTVVVTPIHNNNLLKPSTSVP
uniref:Uncharacterized protein n=1 Tax=Setaria digitata TaxID=48799 RepID=A0A915PXQ5_9BILA